MTTTEYELAEALQLLLEATKRANPKMDETSELARLVNFAERVLRDARATTVRERIQKALNRKLADVNPEDSI